MLTDYHVHIENGDYTLNYLQEFVSKAKEKNITELGISEHCYRFLETSHIYSHHFLKQFQTENITEYLTLLNEAQKYFDINILKSIEMDYYPGAEDKIEKFFKEFTFDYTIGSVHFLGDWGFDIPDTKYVWDNINIKEAYLQYFNSISQMADSGLFDIVGHFDVIKVFGHEPSQFDNELLDTIKTAASKIKYNNMLIEVNTAGLRKPVGEIYPKKSWLKMFCNLNIPIVLSSDAHYPEDVGADYSKALTYIKEAGYKEIAVLQNNTYKLIPVE